MAWEDCCGKSMLDKSRERSKAKKPLHRNFKAGHVTPNEHYLERAGLRGRKIGLCYCFLLIILLFATGHLAVTCAILGVLRFQSFGFPYFTFNGSSTVWPEGAHLNNITIATPHGINGFTGSSLSLMSSQGEEIRLQAQNSTQTLSLTPLAVNFTTGDLLNITSRDNGKQLLFVNASLLQVEEISAAEGSRVRTSKLTTHMVREVNAISSSQSLEMSGAGGIHVGGSLLNITGGNAGITLTAQRLTLNGNRGIVMRGLQVPSSSSKYHLCVRANGTLFLVPTNPLRCRGQI